MTPSERKSLVRELESLPAGTLVKRTIRGAERFYHQWREDGRTRSRYLTRDEANGKDDDAPPRLCHFEDP